MNGIRFYLEYRTPGAKNRATREQPGNHAGNVFAAFVANGIFWSEQKACYGGLGAVYYRRNSPVAGSSASLDYLATHCLRISEAQAREIHPALFERLDESED